MKERTTYYGENYHAAVHRQSLQVAVEMRLPNHIHDNVDAFPPCYFLYHIHKVFRFVVRDMSGSCRKGKESVELVFRR